MIAREPQFSSVTRWLLLVVGCAVLETAQPMSAQPETAAPARGEETVIFPSRASSAAETEALVPTASNPSGWVFAALVGFGAAGLWWWTRRGKTMAGKKIINGLAVEQTHSLGNRQYLVVAGCDGRRFLLGVTSGQINMLSDLDATKPSAESSGA
jgi:flagellar protein FliO/FliZ